MHSKLPQGRCFFTPISLMAPSSSSAASASAVVTRAPSAFNLAFITLLTGIGAGIGGMLLGMLLHGIQHLAYGYSDKDPSIHATFLDVVNAASPERRVAVLVLCGLVAGIGWWAVYRFGKKLVSVRQAVAVGGPAMPVMATIWHALLQIVTVALGSPLGREVAPREIGALVGGKLALFAQLPDDTRRIIVACGAGAGLAAVYNAPLGAAVFVLEVLLVTFSARAVIMALGSCAVAAVVAWTGLGQITQYSLPQFDVQMNAFVWVIVTAPVFGAAGFWFAQVTNSARQSAAKGWMRIVLSLINFTVIGVLAIYLPELLGNGKSVAQLGFSNLLVIGTAALLLVLKIIIEVSSLRAGADGGLLTPGLSNGALLAVVLGGLWTMAVPGTSIGAFALIGAAAFLASSMAMPLTAIVLMLDLTHFDYHMMAPVILAVVIATMTRQWLSARK